jgi:hypothetical protein
MSDKSLSALLSFIDWMASKGLMQRNTAAGRKAACSKVLGVLDPEEQDDVTQVNIDEAMTRFHNLEGRKYVPASLAVYRSRVGAAIDDFKRHLADPTSFKPGVSQRKQTSSPAKKQATREPAIGEARTPSGPDLSSGSGHSPVNVFPIAIRPDVVVRIQGLPFDLTEAEARKIANVVLALAGAPGK